MYINQHPLRYEIGQLQERIAEKKVKLEYCKSHKDTLDHLCRRIAGVIDGLNLVRLPRTWSKYYPENVWKPDNVMPTVLVNGSMCSLHDNERVYDREDRIVAIKNGTGTIFIDACPTWEVWRRWPTLIIEQFYTTMRAIREEFGSPAMHDYSKTTVEYSYEQLAFLYETKTPVYTATESVNMKNMRYGEDVTELTTKFLLYFRLEIPNAPSGFKGKLFGCQVEEEEVTETRVRTKKRMVCD